MRNEEREVRRELKIKNLGEDIRYSLVN